MRVAFRVVHVAPVLVDHRERGSSIPGALVAAGLDVQLTDLPVGDYVLGSRLAVERTLLDCGHTPSFGAPAELAAVVRNLPDRLEVGGSPS